MRRTASSGLAKKVGHWMWFVFPQVEGLGSSPTSRFYSIKSLDEARAYLAHPVLGPRLAECAGAVLLSPERPVERLFGYPDHLKLKSSMTLFEAASEGGSIFGKVLDQAFDGRRDRRTLQLLGLDR